MINNLHPVLHTRILSLMTTPKSKLPCRSSAWSDDCATEVYGSDSFILIVCIQVHNVRCVIFHQQHMPTKSDLLVIYTSQKMTARGHHLPPI